MITRISKNQPSTSTSTSILHTLHLLCQCNILLHLLLVQNLPLLASSQPPINPSSQNCYAAPCTYLGECRDYSGVCGDTVAYCNVESTWVPACGGGGGLEKPQPVGSTVVATATAASNNVNVNGNGGGNGGNGNGNGGAPPTVSPTTAWEKWISQKNNDPPANVDNEQNNQPDNNNNNNASPTNNNNNEANQNENEDGTNYAPNNQTGTFDANTWGYYGEEEEEGIMDKMKFWQGDDEDGENNAACPSAMESSRTEVVFLVCLGVAWAILL